MQPIIAQGDNTSLETAAVPVTQLQLKTATTSPGDSLTENKIEAVFREVQAARFSRLSDAVDQGHTTCSVLKKDSFLPRIFVDHIFARFEQRLIFSLIVRMPILAPQSTASLPQYYLAAETSSTFSCDEWQEEGSRGTMWKFVSTMGLFVVFLYYALRYVWSFSCKFQFIKPGQKE